MGRSSVAYYRLKIHARSGKNITELYSVHDIENGYGVLAYFKSFLSFVKASVNNKRTIRDEYRRRIYVVKEVHSWGCVVAATILCGTYGDEIKLFNMATGEDHDVDPEEAAGRECSLVLACPKGSKEAEFAVEYRDSDNCTPVAVVFLKQLRALFNELQAPMKPILEPQTWLDNSELEQFSIPVQTVPCKVQLSAMDGSEDDDEGKGEADASLRLVLTPKEGKVFSKIFKNLLFKLKLKQSATLSLPDIVDQEFNIQNTAIQATVSENNRRKSFLIGDEKTPSIRRMLTDFGQDYLSVRKFTDEAADDMLEHYKKEGLQLRSGWDSGHQTFKDLQDSPKWSEDQLLIRKKNRKDKEDEDDKED